MRSFLVIILSTLLNISSVDAQYYYKDILNAKDATELLQAYKENKIKTINVKMLDFDGSESPGFFCQKKISKNYQRSELVTRSEGGAPSLMTTNYDASGRLISTTDSSDISVVKTNYNYNDNGDIGRIYSTIKSQDDDFISEIIEEHIYFYSAENKPDYMYRVKNKRDTSTVFFAYDESGNLALEKNGNTGTKYYYYYDKNGWLTDIVQSSEGRKRLYPDYVFTHNRQGKVIQMITTGESGGDYLTWKYAYENALRTTEKLYGKDRKIMGTIEYTYK